MRMPSDLFPAGLPASALTALAACLWLPSTACIHSANVHVGSGPQIIDVDQNGNATVTGTASITGLSGQFELPPNRQLDPPAPLGSDGNVPLNPQFSYWLASDDQVLVSWSDYTLDLPCSGSSDFQYNLCADPALLSNGASHPSQCPSDILLLQAVADVPVPSKVISVVDPDSHVAVWVFNCPGYPGSNFDCAHGTAFPNNGALVHWPWEAGCSRPNSRFQSPSFQPLFLNGAFQLWASYQDSWLHYHPTEPPDKQGPQVVLAGVQAGTPQTDPVRLRFVAACGPPTASNPNLSACGEPDPTESHWVFDPNRTLSEGFSAHLRVRQLRVFDSPQGISGPIAFCWAELTGGQSPQSISDCNAGSPGPCQASPAAGTTDSTPGTPFSKPFNVRMGAGIVAPDASPWVIGFSDASGGRCPNITNRNELWVEFTLETRP